MRAEWLRRLTPEWEWDWIDTDAPLLGTSRFWQSLAYRFQMGLGVDRINALVQHQLRGKSLDLGWVDKAIFLRPGTMHALRESSRRLVHFTPDTAFHANRSRNFEQSIGLFDLLVTTKSFEIDEYRKRIDRDTMLLTTQGFDPEVHYPRNSDNDRRKEVAFVGLAEPHRERCIQALLDNRIPVRLAGIGWQSFVNRRGANPFLHFAGESLFGADYARMLSTCWIGLGLLSKRFPELHTTRTFEIPACGSILATEVTSDLSRFFAPEEALFFNGYANLVDQIQLAFSNEGDETLSEIASRGRARVLTDGRDYPTILAAILADSRARL